jgi:hypothetical protein
VREWCDDIRQANGGERMAVGWSKGAKGAKGANVFSIP